MPFDEALYSKLLGEELRALRLRRGWTLEKLQQHVQCDRTAQTLRFYEQGERNLSVVRLADMCTAMDELPHELIARVHKRMAYFQPDQIAIDLAAVSANTHPSLQPLQVWARDKLLTQTTHSATAGRIWIDAPTVDSLALLCGMSSADLVGHLLPDSEVAE
jgi:transcriptional regulator with XRE-family HTH domain